MGASVKGSKLLRGNWVELQSVTDLDTDIPDGHTTCVKVSKEGHKGLLTSESDSKVTVSSTKAIYTPLPPPPRSTGQRLHNKKTELLFAVHDEEVAKEQAHLNRKPDPTDYTTTKQFYQNMHPDYPEVEHKTTKEHNFLTDQPASFWNTQLSGEKMPGLTAVGVDNEPFRKNAKFSTPLSDLRTDIASA